MSISACAPVRATYSRTLDSASVMAAAIAALRDVFDFDPELSDDGVVQAARLHHMLSLRPRRSVGPLLAIIDICGPDPVLEDYPADYEAVALARMERRQ